MASIAATSCSLRVAPAAKAPKHTARSVAAARASPAMVGKRAQRAQLSAQAKVRPSLYPRLPGVWTCTVVMRLDVRTDGRDSFRSLPPAGQRLRLCERAGDPVLHYVPPTARALGCVTGT